MGTTENKVNRPKFDVDTLKEVIDHAARAWIVSPMLLPNRNDETTYREVLNDAITRLDYMAVEARTLVSQRNRSAEALEQFKDPVREVAIDVAREQGWCKEGLNQALDGLGIPPASYAVEVVVRVGEVSTRYGTVTVTVEVDDPDDDDAIRTAAIDLIHDDCLEDTADFGDDTDVEPTDDDEWVVVSSAELD